MKKIIERSLADSKTEGKDRWRTNLLRYVWELNNISQVEGYACWLLILQWNAEYSLFFPKDLSGQELIFI